MPMSPRLLRPRSSGGDITPLPLTISDLGLWLDFSTLSTLAQNSDGTTTVSADDDPIGHVSDRSNNSRTFTQSTSNNRPLLKLAAQNGLASAYFDGANDVLIGGAAASGVLKNVAGATSFCVRKLEVPSSTGVWCREIDIRKGPPGVVAEGSRFALGQQSDSPANSVRAMMASANADAGGTGNVRYALSSFAVRADFHEFLIAAGRVNYQSTASGSISYQYNGGGTYSFSGATQTAANTSDTDSSAVYVGNNCKGYVGEVLIYRRTLTDTERTEVRAYLAEKWGITL